VTFAFLVDRPEYRAALAAWYLREWPDLFDANFTPFDELDSCLHRDRLDCTILGFHGGALIGAASLLAEDILPLPECSPWLGTVVVDPELRGRGHGAEIVRAATAHARMLGIGTLHLWTPNHRGFYEKLGWQFVRDYADDFRSAAILRFHLLRNPA
jgi:GNAT superfamily N-acetyltransferase